MVDEQAAVKQREPRARIVAVAVEVFWTRSTVAVLPLMLVSLTISASSSTRSPGAKLPRLAAVREVSASSIA